MSSTTAAPILSPVPSTNRTVVRALSDICFVLGFASIILSILVWLMARVPDAGHGERFGIFIGLWAPTFFSLSDRLARYGKPALAEAAAPTGPARDPREHWVA